MGGGAGHGVQQLRPATESTVADSGSARTSTHRQLARADRVYQIAAAQFYAGQFTEAEAGFTAIARDAVVTMADIWALPRRARDDPAGAPWAGRTPKEIPRRWSRAREALKTIIADPAQAEMHASAEGLLQYLRRARLIRPPRWQRRRARCVEAGVETPTSSADACAISSMLMDRSSTAPHRRHDADDLATVRDVERAGRLAGHSASEPEAKARHRSDGTPRIGHWLLAALATLTRATRARPELLDAAAKALPGDSPAYPTMTFHRTRLLLLSGRAADGARGPRSRARLARPAGLVGQPAEGGSSADGADVGRVPARCAAAARRDPGSSQVQARYPLLRTLARREHRRAERADAASTASADCGNHRTLPEPIRRGHPPRGLHPRRAAGRWRSCGPRSRQALP